MSKLTPRTKQEGRARRHARVRGRVSGTQERPRLSVFRSNRYLYAQLIDDTTGTTLASAHSLGSRGTSMSAQAAKVGADIAQAGKKKGITAVVFDRGGFRFSGRIKALADSAREGGLIF